MTTPEPSLRGSEPDPAHAHGPYEGGLVPFDEHTLRVLAERAFAATVLARGGAPEAAAPAAPWSPSAPSGVAALPGVPSGVAGLPASTVGAPAASVPTGQPASAPWFSPFDAPVVAPAPPLGLAAGAPAPAPTGASGLPGGGWPSPEVVPGAPPAASSLALVPPAPVVPTVSLPVGLPLEASELYVVTERSPHVPAPGTTFDVPASPVVTTPIVTTPAVPDVPGVAVGPGVPFDVEAVRRDFPILAERVHDDRQLIWFDNAATTQKPQAVIDRLAYFYAHENSNIHRAAHTLAGRATDAYEDARETVARFIGASSATDIVFVRGATEAINLVAQAWGGANVGPGDEIVVSHLEHHANIVPWQQLALRTGAVLRVAPVDDHGNLLLDGLSALLGPRTRLVSITHVSNALGTVTPVEQIVELAHRAGARVLIDAAQSVPHVPLDVARLGADFVVFSGHKIYGPTGIGVLYATPDALAETPPWQGGGNMIADVTLERAIYQGAPARYEAGTGNIADAVGLAAALRYVEGVGIERIERYEHELLAYATPRLAAIDGVRIVGTAEHKASVLSFVIPGRDPIAIGKALDREGIAVRAGHHCAQPILRRLGLEQTVRPSFAFYNTVGEIDVFLAAVARIAASPEPGQGAGGR